MVKKTKSSDNRPIDDIDNYPDIMNDYQEEYIEENEEIKINSFDKKPNIDEKMNEKIKDYVNYNYFTLSIQAKKNDKGELKKICKFPKDWTNIKQLCNPNHNGIALICGKKSGIYIVDYDDQASFLNDACIHPELKNHYLKTRKGYHSYFKWNTDVQIKIGSTSVKEKNIDFQGDNKCVFTEPTNYKDEDGNQYSYKFLNEEPLLEMSDDLIQFFLINYLKKTKETPILIVEPDSVIPEIKDISPFINKMLNVEYNWECEKKEQGFRLTHNSLNCILSGETSHSTLNHSCIYINKNSANIMCFSCKPAKKLLLRDYPELKNVKMFLGLIQEKKCSDETTNNDFETLMYEMLETSGKLKYKKEDGWILKPVDGIPTHYEDYLEYGDYLDTLFECKDLRTYRIYRKKVTHRHQLIDYLKNYNKDENLPIIKRDPCIYSFNNGFFNLKTCEFKEFEDKEYNFCSTIYIKKNFDISLITTPFNEIKTPLFDKLVKYHVPDNKVYKILLCLIGRLFFKCKEFDTWQCMLFIKGQANTGKSTFLEIIESFFNPRDIGVIGENLEKTFGLQNLYNKRIIISSDIPVKLSEKLDASTLQKMISGEKVSVAVKNGNAKFVEWSSTMLMAGNFLPDYSDKAGSISRRFAIIDMGKKVIDKDASLKNRILENEIVSLLVKFIKAYKFYVEKFNSVVFEDWGKKFKIRYFDEAREEFKQESDILYCFLNAPPGANETKSSNIWIEHKEGAITSLENFKKTFKMYAKVKHNNQNYKWSGTSDNSTLENLGYEIVTLNICASCGKKGEQGCCENFTRNNRRKKVVIKNMIIRNGFEEGNNWVEGDE